MLMEVLLHNKNFIMMNNNFVLITGASSGIGKEIAIKLSEHYNILLHGRQMDKLMAVKEKCSNNSNQLIWQQDLNEIDFIESSLVNFLALNKISIIKYVHSAGHMKLVPLRMSTIEVLKTTFNINVIAASLICKVLNQKKVNNTALDAIVFISSNISNMGAKALSAYGASKGAVDSLMRCLAMELAPKVRLNSVLPGAVLTEMTEAIFLNEEVKRRMEITYPLGIGKPDDIFQAVNFLLSDNARWITGQQITVDGGRTVNITG